MGIRVGQGYRADIYSRAWVDEIKEDIQNIKLRLTALEKLYETTTSLGSFVLQDAKGLSSGDPTRESGFTLNQELFINEQSKLFYQQYQEGGVTDFNRMTNDLTKATMAFRTLSNSMRGYLMLASKLVGKDDPDTQKLIADAQKMILMINRLVMAVRMADLALAASPTMKVLYIVAIGGNLAGALAYQTEFVGGHV